MLLAGGDEFGRGSTAITNHWRTPSVASENALRRFERKVQTEVIIKEINNLQMPQEIWPI
jgi:hypothetical protein